MDRATESGDRVRPDGGSPDDGDDSEPTADDEKGDNSDDSDDSEDNGDDNSGEHGNDEHGGDTVPSIEMGLFQISVSVTGKTTDDLEDVEATAERLLDRLVERAEDLEDAPDGRGLG